MTRHIYTGLLALTTTYISCAGASYVYTWFAYGEDIPNWELAAQLSIVMGIVLPLILRQQKQI